jgi:hypothetical protein
MEIKEMKLDSNLDVNDPDKNAIWELGQHGGRTRPINQTALYRNLVEVCEVFNRHKIRCWLSHGTMLGVYRDGDFISYDDDADITADMRDKDKALAAEEELRQRGFFVPPQGDPKKPISPKDNMPYADTVAIRDGEKVEIWWFTRKTENGQDVYVYDELRPPPELRHDAKYYDTLDRINFKGHVFFTPSHLKEWIVMMYGQDWNVPQEGIKYNNMHGRTR